jgi:aspartate/methionine/tyrosine aminotransferase
MTKNPDSDRVERLRVPDVAGLDGRSLRDGEREIEAAPSTGRLLDLTYANTKRWPGPDWAIDAFIEGVRHGESYTPYRGDRGVREAVATSLTAFLGVTVDPDTNLILTPGTQAALFAAVAAIVDPGDRVLLFDPEYLATERLLFYHGAEVVRVPIIWPEGGEPSPDMERLEAELAKGIRLLIFSHPNNPTGAVYSSQVMERIAELAVSHDTLVLLDGLYSRLVYDGLVYTHLASLPGMSERTISLAGPSKTESLSGFRIGVATGPRHIVDAMEDVQSVTALRAPAYAQHLLSRWIADDEEYVKLRVADYQELRDWTVDRLRGSGLFDLRVPMGSAYIYPKPRVEATEQEVALALKTQGNLVVNPGYQFGAAWSGHFRICFAQEESAWEAALERMFGVIKALAR